MTNAAFTFYTYLLGKLNATLAAYFQDTATSIIGSISPVVTTLLSIYVMFWGWSMIRGIISEPVTDGLQRILRLTVIVAIALNIGRYNQYCTDFLWNAPDAMAAVVASGNSDPVQNSQFLDTFMSKIWDIYAAFSQHASANPWSTTLHIPDMFEWLAGAFVLGAGICLTMYGFFLLILSKIGLSVMLAVGPIFIILLIFNATMKFFDAWCGQTLKFVFLIILTSAIIKIFLTILSAYLLSISGASQLQNPQIVSALPAIVYCLIGLLVLWQAPALASGLAGGVAISGLGAVRDLFNRNRRQSGRDGYLIRKAKDFSVATARKAQSVISAVWSRKNQVRQG